MGRPPIGKTAMTGAERVRRHRMKQYTGEDDADPRRRRRPDWQRREPRRPEMQKWFDQYLGWTKTAQATARMLVFNHSRTLPDAAYYPEERKREAPVDDP